MFFIIHLTVTPVKLILTIGRYTLIIVGTMSVMYVRIQFKKNMIIRKSLLKELI